MNQRIKELVEQSYEMKPYMVADPETSEIVQKIGYDGQPMFHRDFNREKFAELIVKECINQIDGLKDIAADDMIAKGYRSWDSYSGTIDDAKHKLEEYFGVE
jgi:hypothetical protein